MGSSLSYNIIRLTKTSAGAVIQEALRSVETLEEISYEMLTDESPGAKENVFITLFKVKGDSIREFLEQDVVAFDIDKVLHEHKQDVYLSVCKTIQANPMNCMAIDSGNGVWVLVKLEKAFNEKYFQKMKPTYKVLCELVQVDLESAKLSGQVDHEVFSPRLLRLPGSYNAKDPKELKAVNFLNAHMEAQGWSIDKAVSLDSSVDPHDTISLEEVKYSPLDEKAILSECAFMQNCYKNQPIISEAEWYAMLGVLGPFKNGEVLAHEYSELHPSYNSKETNLKFARAKVASGPRTCSNINAIWGGCQGCKHFGKVKSPVSIKSEGFISTENTGFYKVFVDGNGKIKREPHYEDLIKYWKRERGPTCTVAEDVLYSYSNTRQHWLSLDSQTFKTFCYNKMDPRPRSVVVNETYSTLCNSDTRPMDFFEQKLGKINLRNGVFDIHTKEVLKHSPDYGFRYVLGFEYDAKAKCPNFLKFMEDISGGDAGIKAVLQEFMGYIISGDDCWLHKALLLLGTGRNGKSTFNEICKLLVGDGNYATLNLGSLNDMQQLHVLEGKLANFADENDTGKLFNSTAFKELVSGGQVMVKKLYAQPYPMRNRAKFIFNCNSLPSTTDFSDGLFRRLAVVPFNMEFGDNGSKRVDKFIIKKLHLEMPGIFNYAVEGYHRLREQEEFTQSQKITDMVEFFKDEQDTFMDWFEGSLAVTLNDDEFIPTAQFYTDYMVYCEKTRVKYPQAKMSFSYRLSTLLEKAGARKSRQGARSGRGRGYAGVKFKSQSGEAF